MAADEQAGKAIWLAEILLISQVKRALIFLKLSAGHRAHAQHDIFAHGSTCDKELGPQELP